jgi:hypothetical protein
MAKLSTGVEWLLANQKVSRSVKLPPGGNLPPVPEVEEQGPRVLELPSGKVAVLPARRRRGR